MHDMGTQILHICREIFQCKVDVLGSSILGSSIWADYSRRKAVMCCLVPAAPIFVCVLNSPIGVWSYLISVLQPFIIENSHADLSVVVKS